MRCVRCLGQKKVMGLGWMEIECPACDGLGVKKNDAVLPVDNSDVKTMTLESVEPDVSVEAMSVTRGTLGKGKKEFGKRVSA